MCGHTEKNILVHDHPINYRLSKDKVTPEVAERSHKTVPPETIYDEYRDGPLREWFEIGEDVSLNARIKPEYQATHAHDQTEGLLSSFGAVEYVETERPTQPSAQS